MRTLEDYIRAFGVTQGTIWWTQARTQWEMNDALRQAQMQQSNYAQAQADAGARRHAEKMARHAWAYGMGADKLKEMLRNRVDELSRDLNGGVTPGPKDINAEPGSYEWKD